MATPSRDDAKPGESLTVDRRLAERRHPPLRGCDDAGLGGRADHDLDQFGCRYRVEEVQAEEPRREPQRAGQFVDRDATTYCWRCGVSAPTRSSMRARDATLSVAILRHRLDHQLALVEEGVIRAGLDAGRRPSTVSPTVPRPRSRRRAEVTRSGRPRPARRPARPRAPTSPPPQRRARSRRPSARRRERRPRRGRQSLLSPIEELGHPSLLFRRLEQHRLRLEIDARMLAARHAHDRLRVPSRQRVLRGDLVGERVSGGEQGVGLADSRDQARGERLVRGQDAPGQQNLARRAARRPVRAAARALRPAAMIPSPVSGLPIFRRGVPIRKSAA